jgi:hypothetical protein
LLLPLAFLWSWAGCVSVCAENTARHHHDGAIQTIEQNEKHAFSASDKADGCRVTANAALLQERQTVKASALPVALLPVLPFRAPNPAWSALLPEIKQNSPPLVSSLAPLFVRLCTFRI